MRGGEREEDEAGGQPQPLQNIAACQNVHIGSGLWRLILRPDHREGHHPCTARLLRPPHGCHKISLSPLPRGEGQEARAAMLKKILIANRGEIAVRIIRTARKLGVRTVAVVSEADRGAPFASMADEVVEIGPGPASESYLRGDRIIAAARESGAEGIQPGDGVLAENAD